ncbi:hypothetical protein OUZ56_023802 [Daphnia magna]|uniref:Uncharacterized protein n=1 Tax=Daphnia magna TaxID=35525 RepID=A0ABR0AZJ6_9CRUS|nr:hypothetical protein OUZ56_023802 [Daphnia magna]
MAHNPAESAVSIKSKLKESREKEEESVWNLKENQLQLVQTRKEAVNVIYAHGAALKIDWIQWLTVFDHQLC